MAAVDGRLDVASIALAVAGKQHQGQRPARIGARKFRIELGRTREFDDRLIEIRPLACALQILATQVMRIRLHVVRRRPLGHRRRRGIGRSWQQRALECGGDFPRNLALDREHVVELAIVGLGPEVIAVRSFHELRRDAQLIALLAYAPFEHVGNTQLPRDLAQVLVAPLEGERRGPTGNLEFTHVGEQVEQLLRDTVGEVLLVLGSAHVDEWQHGDGDGTALCSCLRAGITDRRALEDVGIDDHEHERCGQHADDQEIELASR